MSLGMEKWWIGGALVLALGLVGGVGAYAMAGDDSAPAQHETASEARQQNEDDARQAQPGTMAMCVQDAPDCDEMVLAEGDLATCSVAADVCEGGSIAVGEPSSCPAGMACIEPWLMDPPACPQDVAADACYPRPGRPYMCARPVSPDETVACVPPCPQLDDGGIECIEPCGPLPLEPQQRSETLIQPAPAATPPEREGDDAPPPTPPSRPIEKPVPLPMPCPAPVPCLAPDGAPCIECVPEAPCIACSSPAEPVAPTEPQTQIDAPIEPCVIDSNGCVHYADGSGACSGSSGAMGSGIVEPDIVEILPAPAE